MGVLDTNLSRIGAINQGADPQALFLKVFGGEVFTAYSRATAFQDRHYVRTISSGKSAQFPFLGRATAGYHTPGTWIEGQNINGAEQVITIDDLLVAAVSVANFDEAMSHFDVRQPYAHELGQILAKTFDINVARCGILAARSSNPVTGLPGGSTVSAANMNTDSNVLGAALFTAQKTLDEKDVPEGENRTAFFRPAQFYLLAQNTTYLNQWYDGRGSISEGTIPKLAGLPIVKTNNLPNDNVTTGPTKYQGDFTKTVGLVMAKDAVGTVKLMDLAMESEYEPRRQSTFMVAKYACGHGILRPTCAVELAIP